MIMDALMRGCIVKIHDVVQQRLDVALGVENEVKSLRDKMEAMKDYLEDADRKRIQDKAIHQWSVKLKEVLYDVDDTIDACRMKGDQLFGDSSFSSSPRPCDDRVCCRVSCFGSPSYVPLTHEIEMRLRKLNNKMEELAKKKSRFVLDRIVLEVSYGGMDKQIGSSLVGWELVGKANLEAANAMVEMVTRDDERSFLIFAITGAGGIGKTTLARKVYNDSRLSLNFKVRVWVKVSRISETELLKQVIRGAGGDCGQAQKKAELREILKSAIAGKKIFLVLDDAGKSNAWEDCLRAPMEQQGTTGRILITTRNSDRGAAVENVHVVKELSAEDGWSLLSKNVFHDGEEKEVEHFKVIGEQIVGRCSGLPLAIKAVAGVLRTKGRSIIEWDKIHQSSVWGMKELPSELQGPNSALYLSYLDLPPPLKQCFLYCSLFPEESELRRWELVRLWVAEGFVPEKSSRSPSSMIEDVAEDYYFQLITRNFLQPIPHYYGKSKSTMHDLLRSLAVFLTQNETHSGEASEISKGVSAKIRHLSVSNTESNKTITQSSLSEAPLRTLISLQKTPRIPDIALLRLPYLRVLVIKGIEIETVPDCIGHLTHLRLLNLEDSKVQELPECISNLSQLQVLDLRDCKSLHHLPAGITKLKSLQSLLLAGNPLTQMPNGIGKVRSLNEIIAFVMSENEHNLEELKSLSNLRVLHTTKLENAEPKGPSVLADKIHLKELILKATLPKTDGGGAGASMERMELLLNELCPPTTVEVLQIGNYIGRIFPTWMSSPPRLSTSLPNLVYLYLTNCVSCRNLPPVGQLLQLKYLEVSGAIAVVSIDKEFLGSPPKTAKEESPWGFPKLEVLKLRNMPHWEAFAVMVHPSIFFFNL